MKIIPVIILISELSLCGIMAQQSAPQSDAVEFRKSVQYSMLYAALVCTSRFEQDCLISGQQVKGDDPVQILMQRSVNESRALKLDNDARELLKTESAKSKENQGLCSKMDHAFEIRQSLHEKMIQVIDRVSKGEGHVNMSEVGKSGADALDALDEFEGALQLTLKALVPALSQSERTLIVSDINRLFSAEAKIYDAGKAEGNLREEVCILLLVRDALSAKNPS